MSHFTKIAFVFSSTLVCGVIPLFAQSDLDHRVAREMDSLVATYKHLHANPELSTQEKESSALLASELRKLGYDVTDHFGRYDSPNLISYGIVGVLRNGSGPTVYVRTDMDALPVLENTGLPYASHVKVKRADGSEVTEVNLYGPSSDGHAQEPGAAPVIKEQQVVERRKAADGSVVETLSVRRPTYSDPTKLGALEKVSETVCRATTISEASTMGSLAFCGAAPWPP